MPDEQSQRDDLLPSGLLGATPVPEASLKIVEQVRWISHVTQSTGCGGLNLNSPITMNLIAMEVSCFQHLQIHGSKAEPGTPDAVTHTSEPNSGEPQGNALG